MPSMIHWVELSWNRKQKHSAYKTVINIELINAPNYFRIAWVFFISLLPNIFVPKIIFCESQPCHYNECKETSVYVRSS